MPQPPRTLGQMVNTRPVRRNMTPQEWAALQAQGSQGMERRVGPISLAGLVDEALGAANIPADPLDWALEGAGELANNPEVQKYLPFLPLLGLVRYKKPGVSASARQTAEQYHRRPVNDVIQGRDTVFHATEPGIVPEILQTGEIRPHPELVQEHGLQNWDAYRKLMPNPHDPWMGVSVSRVPRFASKGSKAVSFEIPQSKMPRTRPFAEESYGKTVTDQDTGESAMNRFFEFENRTYNDAIPLSSVRSAWIDNSALKGGEYINAKRLKDMLREAGIPVREFRSGKEMHSGRARKPLKPPAGMKKHPRDMTPNEHAEWGEEQRRLALLESKK